MRSQSSQKSPVYDTDITNYPFSKVSVYMTGPLPQTLARNLYILTFVCCITGYVEAFAIKNKTVETITKILIDEIFSIFNLLCF